MTRIQRTCNLGVFERSAVWLCTFTCSKQTMFATGHSRTTAAARHCRFAHRDRRRSPPSNRHRLNSIYVSTPWSHQHVSLLHAVCLAISSLLYLVSLFITPSLSLSLSLSPSHRHHITTETSPTTSSWRSQLLLLPPPHNNITQQHGYTASRHYLRLDDDAMSKCGALWRQWQ